MNHRFEDKAIRDGRIQLTTRDLDQRFLDPLSANRMIASPDGREGSVTIHQDATVYASILDGKDAVTHRLAPGRRAYVHVARGAVKVNGTSLKGGDGVRVENESSIELKDAREAEVLLFDLP